MEEYRFQVTRDLKREFYLLFKRHDIQIPYTQVTVNQQDDKARKKASAEETLVALQEQKKLRGIQDEPKTKKKKGNVTNKVKEAFNKTKKELDD